MLRRVTVHSLRRTAARKQLFRPRPRPMHCYIMSQFIRRTLAHELAAVLLAAGTMVVALGLSTAIFSVVYTTVLRPLPYPEPGELVVISSEFPSIHLKNMGLSAPELFELEAFTRAWAQLGAVRFGTATLGGP